MRWLIVGLVLAGCGPRLEQLTTQRHYREAVCAAHDGSGADRDYVHRRLLAELDPQVHVEPVPAEQVAVASSRVRFVRIRLETNIVPVDGLEVTPRIVSSAGRASAPIEWRTLAAITGEALPPPETYSTYAHGGSVLRVFAILLTIPVTGPIALAAGKRPPFTRFRERTFEREASFEAHARTAPVAARLYAAMGDRGCRAVEGRQGSGASCELYVALDPAIAEPLSLELALGYSAQRTDHDACRVRRDVSIPLGTLAGFDARMARVFGPRMRPLRELVVR